jgi:hypothetical protein
MTKLQKLNQDIKALAASIKHWKRMVTGEDTVGSPSKCALCKLYYGDDCRGCPVREDTGEVLCGGSPYVDWEDEEGITGDRAKQAKAAVAELAYLQGLRVDLVDRRRRLRAKRKKK